MAETELVLMTDVTEEKSSSTTGKELWKWPKRKRGQSKSGVERLRQALDARVGRNAEKLADVLTEKALSGSLAEAKVLVELAEGKKPVEKPKKKRRGMSFAQQLAMEPEWSEPEVKNVHPVWVNGEWIQTSEGGRD